jgi:hypothetical protein
LRPILRPVSCCSVLIEGTIYTLCGTFCCLDQRKTDSQSGAHPGAPTKLEGAKLLSFVGWEAINRHFLRCDRHSGRQLQTCRIRDQASMPYPDSRR